MFYDGITFVRCILSDENIEGGQTSWFTLPNDINKLSLFAATSGINFAFQTHHVQNVPDIRQCAAQVCETALKTPGLTNDERAFKAVFIPGFIVGYRLTNEHLRLLSEKEQEHEIKTVLAMDITGANLHLFETLASRMKKVGAQDIYDLVQIEGRI